MTYDPNQTCGHYGGVQQFTGKPCKHPAGFKNAEDESGRCAYHTQAALEQMAAKKATLLTLLDEGGVDLSLRTAAIEAGIKWGTLVAWRQRDGDFNEQVQAHVVAYDRHRAGDVEDKTYGRIMADKASPAEIIFFLKNRDPERWRDVYMDHSTIKSLRKQEEPVNLASPKDRLKTKLRDMAKRAVEAQGE